MRLLRSPRSLRPPLELSVRDVERVAEVRLAPGLSVGGVRGKEWCVSSLGFFIRPLELSVGDVGEAVGAEVRLAPGLSVRGVGGSVRGTSSTRLRLEQDLPRDYPLGDWEAVCGVLMSLQRG